MTENVHTPCKKKLPNDRKRLEVSKTLSNNTTFPDISETLSTDIYIPRAHHPMILKRLDILETLSNIRIMYVQGQTSTRNVQETNARR